MCVHVQICCLKIGDFKVLKFQNRYFKKCKYQDRDKVKDQYQDKDQDKDKYRHIQCIYVHHKLQEG